MALLRPFRALRPAADRCAQVASVPYDVVNREEAAALAEGNPWSLLRVTRSEITLPAETDPYAPAVYQAARVELDRLIRGVPLAREAEPALYLYRLRMGEHVQVGIAGTFSVDEYDQERIKKHERTRQDKEDDRTRHILAIQAQTGPVFLAYRGSAELDRKVDAELASAPLYDFTAADGITHTVWKARDPGALVEAFRAVPALYIADGHHRAASASRARAEARRANPRHAGSEDYNFFLAVAFPVSQLRILPYHRVLRDLNGRSPEALLREIEAAGFRITEDASPSPARGQFSLYLAGRWRGLAPVADTGRAGLVESLDVNVLQQRILEPIFGIRDPRTDKRIDFVGGIRGAGELERLVSSGQAAAAFSLYPTTLEDLMAVSDQGQIMPPKSTWFEPKLRDGLLIHLIG